LLKPKMRSQMSDRYQIYKKILKMLKKMRKTYLDWIKFALKGNLDQLSDFTLWNHLLMYGREISVKKKRLLR
jgi:hypothetical protein